MTRPAGLTPERGQDPLEEPERYTAQEPGASPAGLQDPEVEESEGE